jgi:hypothetical protein
MEQPSSIFKCNGTPDTRATMPGFSMKLPALRRQLAQQVAQVNQVLGGQVADFARALFRSKSCQVGAFV